IELEDLAREIEVSLNEIEVSQERQEWIEERLGLIYSLQKKHKRASEVELLQLQAELQEKVDAVVFADEKENQLKKSLDKAWQEVEKWASKLSEKRSKAAPKLSEDIQKVVRLLGMENAICEILVAADAKFTIDGKD